MQEIVFLLLRLGLGTSSPEQEDLSGLTFLNEKQWKEIEELTCRHGVAAIAFDGLCTIVATEGAHFLNHFEDSSFWSRFVATWAVGIVEHQYEWGNKRQSVVIKEIQEKWAANGIQMMLMKGQAMGNYYPNPNHRCPGDIDCYLFGDYAKGNEIARLFPGVVDESWYKHSQILFKGQTIENHQFFVHTRGGKNSKTLDNLLCVFLKETDAQFGCLPGTGVLLPPPMFNAVFLSYHSLAHFLAEGLLLKQLVDWAMFIKRDQDKVDWKVFYEICDKYHFRRFVDVATDIAAHYLNIKIKDDIYSTSSFTPKVLHSALYDDDFIFSKSGSVWSKRLHLVRNLYKNSWKHHQIYQHSIIRQLWFYVVGYFFKTETH